MAPDMLLPGARRNVFCELIQEIKKSMHKWKSERCTFFFFFNISHPAHIRFDEGKEGRAGVSSCYWTFHGPAGPVVSRKTLLWHQ